MMNRAVSNLFAPGARPVGRPLFKGWIWLLGATAIRPRFHLQFHIFLIQRQT